MTSLNKKQVNHLKKIAHHEEIREVTAEIAYALDAHVVQVIGHTGVLYRPSHIAKYQKLSANLKKIK